MYRFAQCKLILVAVNIYRKSNYARFSRTHVWHKTKNGPVLLIIRIIIRIISRIISIRIISRVDSDGAVNT